MTMLNEYRRFDGAPPESLWDSGQAHRDLVSEQTCSELRDAIQAAFQRFAINYGINDNEARILLMDTGVKLPRFMLGRAR